MMEPLLHSLQTLAAPAAELLVSSVWMGLVLVGFAAALLSFAPRLSAGVRSSLWTAVLLLSLLLPVLLVRHSAAGAGDRSMMVASGSWALAVVAVWFACSFLRLLQLGRSALRLRSVARRSIPAQGSATLASLLSGSARRVSLHLSADVSRPSVVGFFRPLILLPAGLLEELSDSELEHVVLHELEHLRRRDDWTNLLQKLSLALFPLHPALLWLDRRLCLERELACDDGVLRITKARKAYAACLARLAEDSMMRRGLSLTLGLLGVRARRSELTGRVHRILRSPASPMGRAQAAAATVMLLAGVVGGSLALAHSPQLVSFRTNGAPVAAARLAVAPAGRPAVSPELFGRATMAKAIMRPPAAPGLRAAVPVVRAVRVVRRAVRPQGKPPLSPYLVLTEWRASAADQAHVTFAVARHTQTSQQTYAAVPVQGGWLLIQL